MLDQNKSLNRRSFIHYASAAFVLPVVSVGALEMIGCASPDSFHLETGSGIGAWRITIASDKEPGEPLIVSGTIYAPDGRTPMKGISLSVYQTDATGRYSAGGNGDNRNTRLHGQMWTNAEGHYEFRTIKPAAYPGRTDAAHIHAYVSGPDYPEYWIDEYLFEDDPLVTEDVRRKASGKGAFSPVLKLTRDSDGVLRGVRDIKIERCSNNCTGRLNG
jgi:protocatechuate 3,4-dioxygenase, beta subunit